MGGDTCSARAKLAGLGRFVLPRPRPNITSTPIRNDANVSSPVLSGSTCPHHMVFNPFLFAQHFLIFNWFHGLFILRRFFRSGQDRDLGDASVFNQRKRKQKSEFALRIQVIRLQQVQKRTRPCAFFFRSGGLFYTVLIIPSSIFQFNLRDQSYWKMHSLLKQRIIKLMIL